jgi:hypothetical protein
MLLFVLGRQPEIGLAELRAIFGREVRLISQNIATVEIDENVARKEFQNLGSVVKIAKVLDEFNELSLQTLEIFATNNFAGIDGKITLGIS